MREKIVSGVITAITIIAILFALLAIYTTVTTEKGRAPSLFGISIMRVVSGSMEPEIEVGDIIITKRSEASGLEVGDVISFYSADPAIRGQINTHRIIAIHDTEDGIFFTTKGDANFVEDAYPVAEEDVIGKMVAASGLFGSLMGLLSMKYGMPIMIIVPLLVIFIICAKDVVRLFRKAVEEEVQAEMQPKGEERQTEAEK